MTTRSIDKVFRSIPTIEGAGDLQWMNVGKGVTRLKRPPGRPFTLHRFIMEGKDRVC